MIWNLKLIGVAFIVTPILLAGSAWYGYNKGRQSGIQQVQTLWDSEKAATVAAHAEEVMKARQREQALQTLADRIRKEKQREAIKLAADYAAVVDSLHDRAETRAGDGGVPEGAAAGVGCTGSGLAKLDAQLLAGYANAAGRLQLAYDECRAKYTEVERQLNGK
jgi:hypothetical protein